MDEARHDFLAGARLAGNQHGRVRRGDLRRLAQHVAPFGGLADDLQVRARRQAIDGSLHARVDPLRPLVVDLIDDFALLAPACSEAEVVRDPPRERHVRAIERQRLLRPERHAHQRLWRASRQSQDRAVADADQPLRRVRARGCAKRPGAQIIDDHVLAFGRHHVRHVGGRRTHDSSRARIEARHPQGIVRQHLAHDRGEPWQRGVNVIRDGELAEQFQRTVEICALEGPDGRQRFR